MTIARSLRLREATRTLHGQAERAGVMPALLRGELPLAGFCAMQRNLHALYAALEPALARQAGVAGGALAPLVEPVLARRARLADDLVALHGSDWAEALPLLPAAADYVRRLAALEAEAPLQLAAHAYVRYLGDLAGGQAIDRCVRRAYGLDDGRGTRFFDFGPPAATAALAGRVRQVLDALPLDDAGTEALLDEACWGFGQHVALFEHLAAAPMA